MRTYKNPTLNHTPVTRPKDYGREINRIIIHCTATSQSATVENILKYFKNTLKWRNPGYHYIIAPDGTVSNTHPLGKIANGVRGFNRDSVNISYIGGKHEDDRTQAQKDSMRRLVKMLRRPSNLGLVEVVGHRDMSPDTNHNGIVEPHEWIKLCPSFEVSKWLIEENIR